MTTFIKAISRSCAAVLLLGLAACATADPNDLSATDKYPKFNRAMHEFNVGLDQAVIRPAAQAYDVATPTLFKHVISNGFSHLELPADFVNFALQGEVDLALETLGRLTLNTVLGIGVLDPATEFGLPKRETDFGITLAKHGVEEGSYLVLPLFGPTTVRDGLAGLVDRAMDPLTYLGEVAPGATPEASIALTATEITDARYQYRTQIDDILYESADSYVSLRSVYLQRRRAQVAGDESGVEALPDIFDTGN